MNKFMEAARRFLVDNKSYKIYSSGDIFDFVILDDDTIIFVDVCPQKSLNEDKVNREVVEEKMLKWIADNDFNNVSLRYDKIIMVAMGDRALVKYHVNALGV